MSARLDGEAPGVDDRLVDQHLASCAACRTFAEGGARLRRQMAVRPADAVPDLTRPILDSARASRRPIAARGASSASHWTRWALLAVALTQLAVAVLPMLVGQGADVPVHLARELGAWDLAFAAALLLVVARPARAGWCPSPAPWGWPWQWAPAST